MDCYQSWSKFLLFVCLFVSFYHSIDWNLKKSKQTKQTKQIKSLFRMKCSISIGTILVVCSNRNSISSCSQISTVATKKSNRKVFRQNKKKCFDIKNICVRNRCKWVGCSSSFQFRWRTWNDFLFTVIKYEGKLDYHNISCSLLLFMEFIWFWCYFYCCYCNLCITKKWFNFLMNRILKKEKFHRYNFDYKI